MPQSSHNTAANAQPKPYKAKSLAGAQRKARELQRDNQRLRKQIADLGRYLVRAQHVQRMLARLAAKGPAFDNPIIVWEAEAIRDQLLAELGLSPDGEPLPKPPEKSP